MFRTKNLVRLSLITAALAVAPAAYAETHTDKAVATERAETPAPAQQAQQPQQASHDDASSYAQRQHKDKAVENYQGGAVILISGGAVLVALILLILLL